MEQDLESRREELLRTKVSRRRRQSRSNLFHVLPCVTKTAACHTMSCLQFLLEARQMKLFTELVTTIYPIERVHVSSGSGGEGDRAGEGNGVYDEFTIRGIELPMVIDTRCARGYVFCLIPPLP